jgi:hypothetical protein
VEEKLRGVSKLEPEVSCGERRQGVSKGVEPEFIPAEIQGEVWISRPTSETVERLIKWFSNARN